MEKYLYIVLAYLLCNIILLGLSKRNRKWRRKDWVVSFCAIPIFLPVFLCYCVYQIYMRVKYRNRPRPLKGALRRFLKKDCIINENNTVESIDEYNRRHGTSFTLYDVYGEEPDIEDDSREDKSYEESDMGSYGKISMETVEFLKKNSTPVSI